MIGVVGSSLASVSDEGSQESPADAEWHPTAEYTNSHYRPGQKVIDLRIGINAHLLSFDSGYRQAGISRYVDALLRELPALLGPADELVCFTDKPVAERYDPAIEWVQSAASTSNPLARIAWEQTMGALVGRRWGLDVLHAPVNVMPIVSMTPTVVTVHDLAFERIAGHYPATKRAYQRILTRLSVRRAEQVIAVSQSTADDVAELYGASRQAIEVVPNGIDATYRPQGHAADQAFRAEHGLPDEFLLFVGTLQPRKNLSGLIHALELIKAEIDWPLVVVGGRGWLESDLARQVRRYDLGERVRFAGYVPAEELPQWYSAATVFVLPSYYEGFGLPALEAMACGTPVVVSGRSSFPEVVGAAGLLVDPEMPRSIAAGILRLARDRDLREQLASRGRERAKEYSWTRTARETLDVYRRIAAG